MKINELSGLIIASAIEVHRHLGPGLLESAYEECLCAEFEDRGISFERQKPLPVAYKGRKLDCGYRIDVLVSGLIVVELKTVEEVLPIHLAQVLTYLKLGGWQLGLLMNFNVPILAKGVRRVVNGLKE